MRQWLIHSSDGTPRGPASTTDIARAVHAGILDRLHHVAPTGSPEEWKPVASIREIERAIAELSFPENDEDDAALRTLIANPAELAMLEAELAREAEPDSMESVRRLEPTAHAAPRARAAAAQTEPSAPLEHENPNSEPRTLVVRSPVAENSERAEPEPVYVVLPTIAVRAATVRAPLATDSKSAAAERREVEEARTVVATDPHILAARPSRGEITASGLAAAPTATMTSARRRVYIALAFAGGLVGGLTMVLLAYALVDP